MNFIIEGLVFIGIAFVIVAMIVKALEYMDNEK